MTFAAHAWQRSFQQRSRSLEGLLIECARPDSCITPEEAIAAEAYLKPKPVTGGTVIRKWIV